MIYFVIVIMVIIGISFIVWYSHQQDRITDTPVRPFLNRVSKVNIKNIREEFLDNYMWACDVFGVRNNVYKDNYEHWLKNKKCPKEYAYYFDYFVCFKISESVYSYYPKGLNTTSNSVSRGIGGVFATTGAEDFMREFNEIVLQYRKDDNIINEIKELGISPADYLKTVNKHQPQTIDIQ